MARCDWTDRESLKRTLTHLMMSGSGWLNKGVEEGADFTTELFGCVRRSSWVPGNWQNNSAELLTTLYESLIEIMERTEEGKPMTLCQAMGKELVQRFVEKSLKV